MTAPVDTKRGMFLLAVARLCVRLANRIEEKRHPALAWNRWCLSRKYDA